MFGVAVLGYVIAGMAIMLMLVILSHTLHRRLRYDYRTEWMRFSMMLFANEEQPRLSTRVIKAIADRVGSHRGILFEWEEKRGYVLKDCWKIAFPDQDIVVDPCEFTDYLARSQRTLEFSPDSGKWYALTIPDILNQFEWAGIVVPLLHGQHLHAFILLARPQEKTFSLNWELLDILSMASRQAVICLVEEKSTQALAVAKQFEGYNRLSAFVMHDLKNVLSQLKLISSNCDKHYEDPHFIKAIRETIVHVAEKLDRLLLQMRTRQACMKEEVVNISAVLKKVIDLTLHRFPVPRLAWKASSNDIIVKGDSERFVNILCHLIENAQQATAVEGEVVLSVDLQSEKLMIDIQDTGCGMDPEFIHSSLYKPFVTTKGEKGTGIGVYEAREYIDALGGKLHVKSEKNKGSTFSLEIPMGT